MIDQISEISCDTNDQLLKGLHQIRDEDDLIRHVEYIHYKPVKHGLTNSPKLWPYSSFHRYVKREFITQIGATGVKLFSRLISAANRRELSGFAALYPTDQLEV